MRRLLFSFRSITTDFVWQKMFIERKIIYIRYILSQFLRIACKQNLYILFIFLRNENENYFGQYVKFHAANFRLDLLAVK